MFWQKNSFYLQQNNIAWIYNTSTLVMLSLGQKVECYNLTNKKLGFGLFRQLKDAIVHSGVPSGWFRKQKWWVWAEMIKRGLNHSINWNTIYFIKTIKLMHQLVHVLKVGLVALAVLECAWSHGMGHGRKWFSYILNKWSKTHFAQNMRRFIMSATLLLIFYILHFVARHSIPLSVTGHQGTGRGTASTCAPRSPDEQEREM